MNWARKANGLGQRHRNGLGMKMNGLGQNRNGLGANM